MRDRIAEIIRNARMSANPMGQVGFAEADALIAHGVVAQEWISVKDRLPESKKCVLMYSANGGVAEGEYDESTKKWCQFRWSVCDVRKVTHWMPLPNPPKGE